MKKPGLTIIELLAVLSTVLLLVLILVPSFFTVRQRARLGQCAAIEHDLAMATQAYAAGSRRLLPPFAMSDLSGNVSASGHWGGFENPNDPAGLGRRGMQFLNLEALVHDRLVTPLRLICPGADDAIRAATASLFSTASRFSTYCVRLPSSEDLFAGAPSLVYRDGTLLGIYRQAAGGQSVRVGVNYETVPQVRTDTVYRLAAGVTCGDGDYNVASEPILSDLFWWQDLSAPAAGSGVPLRASWCHGKMFNVARGDGSVRIVTDDGTVAANSNPPGGALPDDRVYGATYAERVWQFFDAAR